MKKLVFSLLTLTIVLSISSCSKDDNEGGGDITGDYKIVNNGNGGVTSITDSSDSEPLQVVQAVPSVQDADYPKSMPVILFFNDKIYLNSLENGFEVT